MTNGVVHAWVGQIVTFFAHRPPSRPLGFLTPTQPGRVTNPTQGHPGPPWEAPQAECELGLSPLSLSTIATLSGSHVIAGAAVAMSSLGSAVPIAMMVGGGGAPPLAAWLGPSSRLDPCTRSGTVLIGSIPLSTLNAQPPV